MEIRGKAIVVCVAYDLGQDKGIYRYFDERGQFKEMTVWCIAQRRFYSRVVTFYTLEHIGDTIEDRSRPLALRSALYKFFRWYCDHGGKVGRYKE
jgi:hypothetical protein